MSKQEAQVVGAVEKRLFIDGKWVDAADGRTFVVVDPSTGATLCAVADAAPADGRAALDAAVAAQPAFAATSPRERALWSGASTSTTRSCPTRTTSAPRTASA